MERMERGALGWIGIREGDEGGWRWTRWGGESKKVDEVETVEKRRLAARRWFYTEGPEFGIKRRLQERTTTTGPVVRIQVCTVQGSKEKKSVMSISALEYQLYQLALKAPAPKYRRTNRRSIYFTRRGEEEDSP
jgi:hypothetical protein